MGRLQRWALVAVQKVRVVCAQGDVQCLTLICDAAVTLDEGKFLTIGNKKVQTYNDTEFAKLRKFFGVEKDFAAGEFRGPLLLSVFLISCTSYD